MENQLIFQRYELKYLLTRRQRDALLRCLGPEIEPDVYPHSSIRNLYFDTPDHLLIRRSLEKPAYKEKLRLRSYGTAGPQDTVFLELKKKYDELVSKRRILLPQEQALGWLNGTQTLPDSQIARELETAHRRYGPLQAAVFLSYERDCYRAAGGGELRLTFDESICFRTGPQTLSCTPGGTALLRPEQVLLEIKTPQALPLWLVRALSRAGLRQTGFSKYGAAYRTLCAAPQKGEQYA